MQDRADDRRDGRLGHPCVDHHVPRRASQARDRRAVAQPSVARGACPADTAGASSRSPTFGELDAAIPMREVTRTLETRDELWDAPLFYVTIVTCLTIEWILRKKYRMV